MERRPGRNSSPRFIRVAVELGVRPPAAGLVQRGSPRMVTSLVTSRTGSCCGSNTVSSSGQPPGGISPPQRITSPLPGRSPESGEVLTWGHEPARPPADSGELQPELQPGTVAACGEPLRARPRGWPGAPLRGRVLAGHAVIRERGGAGAQCTPARPRRTPTAHSLAHDLLVAARTRGAGSLEIVEAGR